MITAPSEIPLLRGLSRRLHQEDVSVRTRMLELASELDDVIHLGRGDPDFDTPEHIVEAGLQALRTNKHHYTHPAGLLQLRQAISRKLKKDNELEYGADEIIVTAGVQEAISLAILGLVEPGDEVLISQPRYTSYDYAIHLTGGVPVSVPTYEDDDFALMPERIEESLSAKSKIIVLVTPNNPTGAVTPPDAIEAIAELAIERDLLVISDEIYEKLIYDGRQHLSIASLPGMRGRTVTVNGFSKSYAMTGWRVGYLAAPLPVARQLGELRHALSICSPTISQYAALAALEGSQEVIEKMRLQYDERRRAVMSSLDSVGVTYGSPGGAYYVYANVSNQFSSSSQFCEELLTKAQVMIFPGSLFGDETDSFIRISLVQNLDTIERAMERVAEFISNQGGSL